VTMRIVIQKLEQWTEGEVERGRGGRAFRACAGGISRGSGWARGGWEVKRREAGT